PVQRRRLAGAAEAAPAGRRRSAGQRALGQFVEAGALGLAASRHVRQGCVAEPLLAVGRGGARRHRRGAGDEVIAVWVRVALVAEPVEIGVLLIGVERLGAGVLLIEGAVL